MIIKLNTILFLRGHQVGQRVLIALSNHGFGHLDQAAPAVQALKSQEPKTEIIVRTKVPAFKLQEKLGNDVPCIAFSSLNWAEIYRYYFGHPTESSAILKQMLNAPGNLVPPDNSFYENSRHRKSPNHWSPCPSRSGCVSGRAG